MDYLRILDALEFAKEAHAGQPRKGTDIPYIVHPLEVADIVRTMTDDEEIIMAALLHDVMEDAEVPVELLERRFGKRVAELVAAESENKREDLPEEDSWETRKRETVEHLKTAPLDVQMIALGDKLANARAICRDYDAIGEDLWDRFNAPPEKIAWYYGAVRDVLWEELSKTGAWCELDDLMSHDAFFLREERSFHSAWYEKLDRDIKKYNREPEDGDRKEDRLSAVFEDLVEGIQEEELVAMEAYFDENSDEPISFKTYSKDGMTGAFYSVITSPNEVCDFFGTVKLKTVIRRVLGDDRMEGIVINIRNDCFQLPKEALKMIMESAEE